ncbi:MAG: energy-coupling factor ABC transporter permease [Oscillospiraceae bacterium]|nr:energy-coupling factor ABC transporter permease [Oscillospiraceae bacterium]
MHMADALLNPAVGGVMWAAGAAAIGVSAKKAASDDAVGGRIPLMAVSGAFVFAAQMINFTIPGTGSSGHIGGGILLAALLGPFPALLTIASVLLIQCLFFADGGLIAYGANLFNMGVIPCLLAYPLVFKPMLSKGWTPWRLRAASVVSATAGLLAGAFCVVLETLASGITLLPFGAFTLLMMPIHLAIGIVEGVITAAVLSYVYAARPEILERAASGGSFEPRRGKRSLKPVLLVLAAAAVVTGALLSQFASSFPDGLEWSIERTAGGAELESDAPSFHRAQSVQDATAFMPDYGFGEESERGEALGTATAGIIGAGITAALAVGAGVAARAFKRGRSA